MVELFDWKLLSSLSSAADSLISKDCVSRMPKRKAVSKPEPAAAVEPGKLKVAELKEELSKLGLDTTGKKAELVARLEQALNPADTDGPSPPKKAKSTAKAPVKKKGGAKKEPSPPAEEGGVDESDFSKAVRALTSAKPKKTTFNRKADPYCYGGHIVVDDWDCMLNQTNIGHNNNKFYVIQLLKTMGNQYLLYTRWGRVGETGKNEYKYFSDIEEAKKQFCKKFQDKTKNKWENRDNFKPAAGKYTLLEMDDDEEEDVAGKMVVEDTTDGPPAVIKPCSLDGATQKLVKLIFDNDMFNDALKSMEIDTKKMPLGKLSKLQIAKGFEALEAIETALNNKASGSKLAELTSRFYTIIPHDFGRRVPAPIKDHETLQKKFDMLLVLGDIEIAQGLKTGEPKPKATGEEVPHPLDINYGSLKAQLRHVNKTSEEFKVLDKYLQATQPHWHKLQLLDVWSVDRDGESDRFKAHETIENRRLLWHGTNVAVVAAILKSGLRIMPHSGGRVGKGIYFASECSKSAGYVRTSGDGTGIMFLNEVALGNEKHITRDDWTLTAPPPSFDCIIAKGRTEPDPKKDTSIKIEGKTVTVPQGEPIPFSEYSGSSFSQSEYLVYKESQARIRYLLKLKFR